jgi:hypothetical protein
MMYFNTTTIPTEYTPPFLTTADIFTQLFFAGGSLVTCTLMGAFTIYLHFKKRKHKTVETELEEKGYADTYQDAFDALERRELSAEEISGLAQKIVRETTPGGDVIMSYNKSSEAFVYYTDNLTDISYEILETVAQKFAIEYNCKALCVERKTVQIQKQIDDNLKRRLAQAEQAQAEQLQLQAQAERAQAEQAQAEEKPKERSLFATFKTYNTATKGGTPNFNNGLESVNEQITNHFRFRGKTKEYEENEKARIAAQEAAKLPVMDYNSFKQMMKENKTC